MGRYIDDILQPGEKVLYSATAHWIVYWQAILCWIVAALALTGARMIVSEGVTVTGLAVAAIVGGAALIYSMKAWFHRWTTETDVTTERVVHKTGFIKRSTFEMNIDKVESVDVEQSVLGRLLGYGDVTILGVGEGKKTIRCISSPLDFRSHITAR